MKELKDKISWYRDNQKLLDEDSQSQKDMSKELTELRLKVQRSKDDKKTIANLEKKCKLLEETLNSKKPNSIGMLI